MYLTLKPLLVLAVTGIAFYFFIVRAKKLVNLLQAVQGVGPKIENIPARVWAVFVDVLLQGRVRQKFFVGIAHTAIFWGFLVITIGTIEMLIEGVIHGFSFANISSTAYGWYLTVADFMTIAVILGCFFGFYRRYLLKPAYLTNGIDAKLILLFTVCLMVTLLGMNAFRIALYPENNLNTFFVFSASVTSFFQLWELSPTQLFIGQEFFYWGHILLVLGFLVYIPGSKHLHVLTAAPNIFFKHLGTPKAIQKTNLEDENAESFGLGKANELSWKNVLDLYACTECGRCEEVCPASNTGKPLSPKKLVHDYKVELLDNAELLLDKEKHEQLPTIVRNDGEVTPDVIWACTSCRACEQACPVNIEQTNLIFEARKNMVLMEANFPKELQTPFKNMENNFTPWAFGHDTRADWAKELNVKMMSENPDADVLFWVGCAGSFDDRAKKVSTAVVRLLQKAGVNFSILGTEEKCTGDPARRAGNEYLAQMLIQENVETLNKYKPKKIIASCPHCFNTLKNEYPEFGAQYETVHHTTYLNELVQAGRLKLDKKSDHKITYHDSCYLGRWNDEYDSPRELLNFISDNVVEMKRNRKNGFCCGAGGARMFMEESIGTYVNINRTEEALSTGANKVASGCPFCSTMLNDGVKSKEKQTEVEVQDIAELLDEATGKA